MVHKLIARIRALHLGPIKSAKTRDGETEEPSYVDTRQTAIQWIGDPGVQAIRRGRYRVVVGECWLVQTVVAETRFVDPVCVGRPDPTQAQYLRARVNAG